MNKYNQVMLYCTIILSCVILSTGVVLASNNFKKGIIDFSNVISTKSFDTVINRQTNDNDNDFLAIGEVPGYLGVDVNILDMIEQGEFAGAYTIVGGQYIFSKEELRKWFIANIAE